MKAPPSLIQYYDALPNNHWVKNICTYSRVISLSNKAHVNGFSFIDAWCHWGSIFGGHSGARQIDEKMKKYKIIYFNIV